MECPICYESIATNAITLKCCGNMFHVACVHTWVNTNGRATCPMCRSTAALRPFEASPTDMDACDMVWPCDSCGGGDETSEAITCEGPKCLADPRRDVYAFDARARCFGCAGVTAATVARAPPFVCARCTE